MFIRVNSLKKFTAIYGAAGSYGRLYREEIISGLLITGGMYKGKLAKKLDATIILACVYPPYTKYYTQDWFKSTPVIVPFFNFNYKMTKTFGIGLTGGTTYMAGQNASPSQMKLLLTRIGFNSKFFISGDVEQSDKYKNKTHSGLWDAIEKFRDSETISIFEFKDKNDIVRNPLISKILKKYEE